MKDTLYFKPHARLLTMLGDQLIKNERIALVEIIKNSYDADASWVKVTFEGFGSNFKVKPPSKIIIEDDGTGMTKTVLEQHWISPATPIKKLAKATKDSTSKGRKIQGEKGIGRFALLKLGKTISIVTRPANSQEEYRLALDLSHYDDDFLSVDGKSKTLFLEDINLSLSVGKPTDIKAERIALGAREEVRNAHGTRIEVTNLRGSWTEHRVEEVYEDLIRLQSIFDDISKAASDEEAPDFEVLIYKDADFQNFSRGYVKQLHTLIDQSAVLRITDGAYDESKKTFKFQLNGKAATLTLNDPDITGLALFREAFGEEGETLRERGTKCGPFTFGFYVFDFSKDAKGKHQLDGDEKKLLKDHRIYLYRDNIRVYPYGDPEDDWLQTDTYRGTKAAGLFLSNDQVVGFVNITQKHNPRLQDKTNREGLIEMGDATSDFRHLLQIFLAWVRKKPYEQYRVKLKQNKDIEIVRKEQVRAGLDALELRLANNKPAQAAVQEVAKLYQAERSYLIQRAETTENLAGVGLSVETASHDIMAVMRRGLVALDSLISETQKAGALSKDFVNRELMSLRGMLSFVEAQLKDIQLLFKSTKQRRKDIRVKEVLQKVEKLFDRSLKKEKIAFNIVERGSPLVAKTTDAVLLQLFLNLFDNAVYWLHSKQGGKQRVEVLLDGEENVLIFSDNGPGIKADDAAYIFEPFYSGRGEEGRGLGLYIAKQLLERHDYSIDLADTKRHRLLSGANFVVSFVKAEE
ncbi:MAG: ATP-binding protein [Bacteroidota bacterium]